MADLRIEKDTLIVHLSPLEQLGALSSGVQVPLKSVTAARLTDDPYAELRGIRVGTGLPYVIVLGRMMFSGGSDFVAIYRTRPTAVIDLAPGSPYRRILVSSPDPKVMASLTSLQG